MKSNKKQDVPGQDPSLWGQELFNNTTAPVDWCTARQAQEERNKNRPADSVLRDIASGRIESSVYSPKEAQQLLNQLSSSSLKERR